MDANVLLQNAISECSCLEDGEIFLLKDLFKGYQWNRIERSTRLLLGTLFLNYINKGTNKVLPLEKTSSGQQKYIIKK